MITDRKILENLEVKALADYAVKSKFSLGRMHKEPEDSHRLCFQKDKERVVHSKAFRRMDEKTQVLVPNSGDHYRTRLTHTLEVAQISRDMARRLALNEDLCEVIALAHDLGHTPFGHFGEYALNEVMQRYNQHFEHNEQSVRVVEHLEKAYPGFDGLNLSIEVLQGLKKHQSAYDQRGKKFEKSEHMEAQVVNVADEVAYTSHDIDDGLRCGILDVKNLKKIKLIRRVEQLFAKKYPIQMTENVYKSRLISNLISLLLTDLAEQTDKNLQKNKIKTLEDVQGYMGVLVEFSPKICEEFKELRDFLYENFYMHPKIKKTQEKGFKMIKKLFRYYIENPLKFPKVQRININENFEIAVKDYVAGMTDRFLIKEYEKYFGR